MPGIRQNISEGSGDEVSKMRFATYKCVGGCRLVDVYSSPSKRFTPMIGLSETKWASYLRRNNHLINSRSFCRALLQKSLEWQGMDSRSW